MPHNTTAITNISSMSLFEYVWRNAVESQPEILVYGLYPFLVQIISYWMWNAPFILYQMGKVESKNDQQAGSPILRSKIVQSYVKMLDKYTINPDHTPLNTEFYWRIIKHVIKVSYSDPSSIGVNTMIELPHVASLLCGISYWNDV